MLLFSILLSAHETYSNFSVQSDSKSILTILYHAFLVLLKFSSSTYIIVFNRNAFEIVQLLNYMCKNEPNILAYNRNQKCLQSKLFSAMVFTIGISLSVFFILFLPFVAVVLPCLHERQIFTMYFSSCNRLWFRLYLFTTQVIYMAPIALLSPILSTACLVTLNEILNALKNLW